MNTEPSGPETPSRDEQATGGPRDASTPEDPNVHPPREQHVAHPPREQPVGPINTPPTAGHIPATSPPSSHQLPGIILRSGTVLQSNKTRLDLYIDNLLETVRESGSISVSQCDALNKRLAQTAEQRLSQIQSFKEATETFKKQILDFKGLSHSLSPVESGNSFSDNCTLSESVTGGDGEDPLKQVLIDWLSDSLEDTSFENSDQSISPLLAKPKVLTKYIMVDYEKVARLTAQMVPVFSGEPGPNIATDLQTFLGCCKQVQQCLTEEEKAAFLQIFPTRLRGEAYQLLASTTPSTFKDAEELLNRTYLPRETYQELVNKLITLRQHPLEALTAFASRAKQLLTLCKEAAEMKYGATAAPAVKQQLEDFAKNAVKSGVINPHLCQYLLTITEESLDTLVQKALDMERLQQTALNLQPQFTYGTPLATIPAPEVSVRMPQTSPLIAPTHPGVERPLSQLPPERHYTGRPPRGPQNPFPSRPPRPNFFPNPNFRGQEGARPPMNPTEALTRNITCNFCNKRGHTYTDCIIRKNTPFCTKCNAYNHDARNCRKNNSPPNAGPPNNRPQREPRVYNVRLKCDFCGRKGHSLETCAQKRKWEARSQGNDSQSTQNSPARL